MPHIVIYYPFYDQLGAATCTAVQNEWAKYGMLKGKLNIFTAVTQPGTVSGRLWLSTLGGNDSVYVLGHCGAGSEHLQAQDHSTHISAAELAQHLVDDGLQTTFSGKIKIFGCSSASSWSLSVYFKTWVWDSFTQLFADDMASRGYTHCRYFGYTNSVRGAYVPVDGEHHKGGTSGGFFGREVPASSLRSEVFPRVLNQPRVLDQIVVV